MIMGRQNDKRPSLQDGPEDDAVDLVFDESGFPVIDATEIPVSPDRSNHGWLKAGRGLTSGGWLRGADDKKLESLQQVERWREAAKVGGWKLVALQQVDKLPAPAAVSGTSSPLPLTALACTLTKGIGPVTNAAVRKASLLRAFCRRGCLTHLPRSLQEATRPRTLRDAVQAGMVEDIRCVIILFNL